MCVRLAFVLFSEPASLLKRIRNTQPSSRKKKMDASNCIGRTARDEHIFLLNLFHSFFWSYSYLAVTIYVSFFRETCTRRKKKQTVCVLWDTCRWSIQFRTAAFSLLLFRNCRRECFTRIAIDVEDDSPTNKTRVCLWRFDVVAPHPLAVSG